MNAEANSPFALGMAFIKGALAYKNGEVKVQVVFEFSTWLISKPNEDWGVFQRKLLPLMASIAFKYHKSKAITALDLIQILNIPVSDES